VELNSEDEIAVARIMVVEDVFTTGSTLKNAVAATLKSAGAGGVVGVALTVHPFGSLK